MVPVLAEAGFWGVMLELPTSGAGPAAVFRGSPLAGLSAGRAHAASDRSGRILGVADIPPLGALRTDYLGFRGALCGGTGPRVWMPAAAVRRRSARSGQASRLRDFSGLGLRRLCPHSSPGDIALARVNEAMSK